MGIKNLLNLNAYLILIITILISCSNTETQEQISTETLGPPTGKIDQSKEFSAVFDTEVGKFTILLFDDKVPYTVENFINLANSGYYDKTTFHRVLPDFMAQGGDPSGTGAGNPGYRFNDEFHVDLRHDSEGIVSMANSGVNTNGSQFFITFAPVPFLDAFDENNNEKNCQNIQVSCHAVFGKVVDGMDIVKSIRLRDPMRDTAPGTVINSIDIIIK
ncbi:MAG: peptidylprolyl isomerase [Chloroflexota bacterium]|nr:peptidylprolyl isomerase [Chloroflexota bacterium]